MLLNLGQRGGHVVELAFHREREGGHRAFHALKNVYAQQMDEAFFTVHLTKKTFAAANLRAVFLIVGSLLVRQHIPERGVGREREAANLVIDFADGTELTSAVNVGLEIDGLEALRKPSGFGGAVIFFDVLARACDGQEIEQLEIIES